MVKLTDGNEVFNKMRSNKNIVKVKVVWKMSRAGGCNGYKATIGDNNAGGRGRGGRGKGRKSTSIVGDMIGGVGVKIPIMLGGCWSWSVWNWAAKACWSQPWL
jgi:hypothetical protein